MKDPKVIAGAAVAVLIVVVMVATFLDSGQAQDPEPTATATFTAAPPAATPTTDPGPSEPVAEPGDETTDESAGGLAAEVSREEYAAAIDVAMQVALVVTTWDDIDRSPTLEGLFVAGADLPTTLRAAGPDDVVTAVAVNWVEPFEPDQPDQPDQLGAVVSVRYEIVRAAVAGVALGTGDAEWRVLVVQDGAGGWAATEVGFLSSTDAGRR